MAPVQSRVGGCDRYIPCMLIVFDCCVGVLKVEALKVLGEECRNHISILV
ncbi:hypothetical protein HanPI659440_Chr06g0223891 [Helianthus annuus]|nr:hypothetical protein HanPI659440_Chr06g0223891 [Helianthus annuus]